jgi:uncharacterized protein
MDEALDAVAARVLGSLIEKESTTPDAYPLTLNALIAACNQTSNRDPVLQLDEAAVSQGLAELDRRSLARAVHRGDARAKRYRHLLAESLNLHPAEIAALGVLLLRGARTAGEIRTRSARLFEFRDVPHVEVTLQALMTLPAPLVARVPRRPGQKEARYAHLLSGEPQAEADGPEPRMPREPADSGRLEAIEEAVVALRAEVAELRQALEAFRRQFE